MRVWIPVDAFPQGKVLSYEQLTGDDDLQRGEVGVQVYAGAGGLKSTDTLIVYGNSLPGLANGLEQLARTVREAAVAQVRRISTDNPRLARILKLNRAHEELVAVLREHFAPDELGAMFDLLPEKQGQPFETLAGAVGTAWAQATGQE